MTRQLKLLLWRPGSDSLASSCQSLPIWLDWDIGCWILCNVQTCGKEIYTRQQFIFNLFTLLNCIKMTIQFCKYKCVGMLGLALQSNSSNCLVLMLHRKLGKYWFTGRASLPIGVCLIQLRVTIFSLGAVLQYSVTLKCSALKLL